MYWGEDGAFMHEVPVPMVALVVTSVSIAIPIIESY
jgi:hypothetical protein